VEQLEVVVSVGKRVTLNTFALLPDVEPSSDVDVYVRSRAEWHAATEATEEAYQQFANTAYKDGLVSGSYCYATKSARETTSDEELFGFWMPDARWYLTATPLDHTGTDRDPITTSLLDAVTKGRSTIIVNGTTVTIPEAVLNKVQEFVTLVAPLAMQEKSAHDAFQQIAASFDVSHIPPGTYVRFFTFRDQRAQWHYAHTLNTAFKPMYGWVSRVTGKSVIVTIDPRTTRRHKSKTARVAFARPTGWFADRAWERQTPGAWIDPIISNSHAEWALDNQPDFEDLHIIIRHPDPAVVTPERLRGLLNAAPVWGRTDMAILSPHLPMADLLPLMFTGDPRLISSAWNNPKAPEAVRTADAVTLMTEAMNGQSAADVTSVLTMLALTKEFTPIELLRLTSWDESDHWRNALVRHPNCTQDLRVIVGLLAT
jgi:hypothetical protein